MRRFWKQRNDFDQLEQELRRSRPQPRSDYVDALATQLRSERAAPPRRPALRYRVGIAVALTSLLAAAAGAFGGLGYASNASSHTVRAVAHVFNVDRSQNRDAARQNAIDARSGRSNQNEQGNDNAQGNQNQGNAAGRQYIVFEFVCLRVPPHNPFIFITLHLPKPAADALVARGVATMGPC
jgi:hypothetical protein